MRQYFIGCLLLTTLMTIWLNTNGTVNRKADIKLYFSNASARSSIMPTQVLQTISSNTTTINFTELNNKRADDLRRRCKEMGSRVRRYQPTGLYYTSGFMEWIWMKSEKHDLFYCAAPKCASSTWKHNLLMDYGLPSDKDTSHTLAVKLLSLNAHLKKKRTLAKAYFENLNERNRLLIIRNPWARVVSAYLEKLVHGNMTLEKICSGKEGNHDKKVIPKFEQFFDCIIQRPMSGYRDSHVHPITDLCAVCRLDYNIIVKQEELPEFGNELREMLGMKTAKETSLRRSTYKDSLSDFYKNTPEWKLERFRSLYKYDIQLFGYPNKPF